MKDEISMQTRKTAGHRLDMRTLLIRAVAILCAVVIVGSVLLAAFG